MEQLSFKLEVFEGPLDLLLHLISKHKLNIYDIEISSLLEQYLDYIDLLQEADIEVAGEFLEMAARLIYIKTVSLLPKYEEAKELQEELTGELIGYAVCKKISENLRNDYVGSDLFVRNQAKIEIDKTYKHIHEAQRLVTAYMNAAGRKQVNNELNAEDFSPLVSREYVSVSSKIVYILRNIYTLDKLEMVTLYEGQKTKSACVAVFLAVLELAKSGRVTISSDNKIIIFNKHRKNRTVKANAE